MRIQRNDILRSSWLLTGVMVALLLSGCEGEKAAWKPFWQNQAETKIPALSATALAAPTNLSAPLAETRWLDASTDPVVDEAGSIWSVRVRIPTDEPNRQQMNTPREVAGFSLAENIAGVNATPAPQTANAWDALQATINAHEPLSAGVTPAPAKRAGALVRDATSPANAAQVEEAVSGPDPEGLAYNPRPYRIRTGDTIDISIPDEPDTRQQVPVQPDGRIRYLYDIEVIAAGKTYKELHDALVLRLKKYYRVPRVTVIGKNFAGNSVFVMGPVKNPGAYTINNNTRLLHVLARSGALGLVPSDASLTLDAGTRTRSIADLEGAYLMRGKEKMAVNFETLIRGIDHSFGNNPILKADDFIFIPSTFGNEKKVFLTGFVRSPQVYRYTGKLTFLEAILQAGGTTLDFSSTTTGSGILGNDIAQNRNVLIVRAKTGEVMRADYQQIRSGQTKDFELLNGDIVFVPERRLAKRSRIITNVIGEVLAPLKAVLDADNIRRSYKKNIFSRLP